VGDGVSQCFVVGGGPSLTGFDFSLLRNKDTITVNNSVFDVPDPNYFITMDYTWLTKNRIRYGKCVTSKDRKFMSDSIHKVFVVAFGGDRCIKTGIGVIDRKFDLEYDLRVFDQVVYSSRYGGIGLTFDDFRTGSDSGYSALQLAVVLGYKKIYLLGMDFTVGEGCANQIHYYQSIDSVASERFRKKLDEFMIPYPKAFEDIARRTDIEVFSCSPISRLNQYIPYIPVDEVL